MQILVKAYPNGQVSASRMPKKPIPAPAIARHDPHHVKAMMEKVREIGIENCLLQVKNGNIRVGRAEPLGLSEDPYFPKRRGKAGLTKHGRRMIENGCVILDRQAPKKTVSMLTLTLPPGYGSEGDCEKFLAAKNMILKELRRELSRAGLPDLIVGVIEPHPKRSDREGSMVPHLHLCFQGRHANQCWLHTPDWYRDLWWRCLCNAGLAEPSGDSSACSRIERVEKSVSRYLSKYMAKTRERLSEGGTEDSEKTCPGSWHIITRTLLRLVMASVKTYVGLAAEYAWDWIKDPSNKEVYRTGDVFIETRDGYSLWVGGWARVTYAGYEQF